MRTETDGLGEIGVPADKLRGAQTQRSLAYISIGTDLMPREMTATHAIPKEAAAIPNHAGGRLNDQPCRLIVRACDEILAGQHDEMVPPHVWMTGSGTQFNMNVNEVISNRSCRLGGKAAGASERSGQYVAVVERQLPVRQEHRRRDPAPDPGVRKTGEYVERSLMLVTAPVPVIGYDKASRVAHRACTKISPSRKRPCNLALSPRRTSTALPIRGRWCNPAWRAMKPPGSEVECAPGPRGGPVTGQAGP